VPRARLRVRIRAPQGVGSHLDLATVVLLHGLCLTQASWANQIRQLVRRWGKTIRIITYDHRGHGRSTGAPMRTYRIDRLAADLAEVLTTLDVEGQLTLAGHSMGGMTALAYLGRPAVDRPVVPQGVVLIATAAGRIAERGIGHLLATPATRMLFELVHHMPRGAGEKAIKAFMRPRCEAITRYPGGASAERNALAAVAAAISTTPFTTAAGFLPSLRRFDRYQTIASIRQYRRRQRRSGRAVPSLPRTRPDRRRPRCYPSAPTVRRAHASPRSTTMHQHRNQLRDGHAPPRLAGMPIAAPSGPQSYMPRSSRCA
jgi:pimeloyl-ACP methyl ester carboxylesterase